MPSRFRVSFALTSGLSLTAATVSGAVVQVDITANFNADIIVNDSSADPIDSAQVGYAVGRNLLTRSATFSLTGDPGLASANLPDDGVFAATSSHALIELAYSNEDDGNNVWSSGGGNQSTTFVMPAAPIGDKYDVVHLLMIGLGGADPVVKLQYDTGPDNETTLTNIPDNGAGADFVLISDLDRFDGGGFTQQNQAISGYSFAVDPNRTPAERPDRKERPGLCERLRPRWRDLRDPRARLARAAGLRRPPGARPATWTMLHAPPLGSVRQLAS